jgi:hypothetical protein
MTSGREKALRRSAHRGKNVRTSDTQVICQAGSSRVPAESAMANVANFGFMRFLPQDKHFAQ